MNLFHEKITDFSFKLFNIIFLNDFRGYNNQIISPYSFSQLLGAFANNLNDINKLKILSLLDYENIHSFNIDSQKFTENWQECRLLGCVRTSVQNFFIYEEELEINNQFKKILKDVFNTTIHSFNIASKNKVLELVNFKSKGATSGQINNLFYKFYKNFRTGLLNIFHFDGVWENRFYNIESDQNLMLQYSRSKIYEDEKCTAVEIKYRNPKYTFLAFVPKNNKLYKEVIRNICTKNGFLAIKNKMKEASVKLIIPKFTFKCTCNFIPDKNFFIKNNKNDLSQEVVIKFDEFGTKVTAISTSYLLKEVEEKKLVFIKKGKDNLFRPFIWFILKYDDNLEDFIPLFVGKTFTNKKKLFEQNKNFS